MIKTNDDAYRALYLRFVDAFGEGIPLYCIPESETLEGLTESVERCFAEGKNLLPEIYDMILDGSVWY